MFNLQVMYTNNLHTTNRDFTGVLKLLSPLIALVYAKTVVSVEVPWSKLGIDMVPIYQ